MSKSIVMACSQCGSRNYKTAQKKEAAERLQLNKYCPKCQTHTTHRQE
ncbi:50S ribosomal protein L33 [Bacillus kwashiorkori]|nr:50S ribosomal protein L33 [Bacillus kwashiorkori]